MSSLVGAASSPDPPMTLPGAQGTQWMTLPEAQDQGAQASRPEAYFKYAAGSARRSATPKLGS